MPKMGQTHQNRGTGGGKGSTKQSGKIRTPFKYPMSDKGSGGKRSSSKMGGKR